ncbi:MAG: hypothetical protein SF053_10850 [Bacteroidia bacterium]|nr:hypothetical protein [Bacteroidia bacterium]
MTHYLFTFNLRDPRRVLLVFHHPAIVTISSDLLEGTYPDRRLVYMDSVAAVAAHHDTLTRIIRELVSRITTPA